MDSFWPPLLKRMTDGRPLHLVIMFRKPGDSFLEDCFTVSEGDRKALDSDSRNIKKLKEASDIDSTKTFHFCYWNGISQGPLVVWRKPRETKETIAMGLWQQVPGSTDRSPWFVTVEGPLYDSLKQHYEKILHDCKPQPVPGD